MDWPEISGNAQALESPGARTKADKGDFRADLLVTPETSFSGLALTPGNKHVVSRSGLASEQWSLGLLFPSTSEQQLNKPEASAGEWKRSLPIEKIYGSGTKS